MKIQQCLIILILKTSLVKNIKKVEGLTFYFFYYLLNPLVNAFPAPCAMFPAFEPPS